MDESNFKMIDPPLLVPTVRWKHNYILIEKKKMNIANKYVLDCVPLDLRWYERDGLLTWYDQIKCKRFLEDPDRHFNNTKIVNFDIINKCVRGEEVFEQTLTNYQTVLKKRCLSILLKTERKLCLLH